MTIYTPGDRVELIRTSDPYTQLTPGAKGTVNIVDGLGTIHVDWDTGSKLGIVRGIDEIRHLQEEGT